MPLPACVRRSHLRGKGANKVLPGTASAKPGAALLARWRLQFVAGGWAVQSGARSSRTAECTLLSRQRTTTKQHLMVQRCADLKKVAKQLHQWLGGRWKSIATKGDGLPPVAAEPEELWCGVWCAGTEGSNQGKETLRQGTTNLQHWKRRGLLSCPRQGSRVKAFPAAIRAVWPQEAVAATATATAAAAAAAAATATAIVAAAWLQTGADCCCPAPAAPARPARKHVHAACY